MKTEQAAASRAALLGNEKVGRLIARFSVPSIVGMLVNALYNMADQIYIGRSEIGMLGIAATNVTFPLTIICMALALMLGVGGAANFNLKLGAGDKESASRLAGNTLTLMVLVGVSLGVLVLLFKGPLLQAFGVTAEVLPYAGPYAAIIAPGVPFLLFASGAGHLIRADGSPAFTMLSMTAGALCNIILDPIFLFVLDMGIAGIALATLLGQMLSAGLALFYLLRRFKTVPLRPVHLRPQAACTKAICTLGLGPFVNQLAMLAVQITMNNTLRHYGALSVYGANIPLAAVGAISKLNTVFMAFLIGTAQGCQPVISFNYGAKKYDRVMRTILTALTVGTGIAVLFFLAFQLLPGQIMALFGEDAPAYLRFAVRYLRTFMLLTFINAVQMLSGNFFTAIGKAKTGVLISLTRQIVFLLPLIVLLPVFWGIDGVMYAGPVADAAAALVSVALITRELRALRRLHRAQGTALGGGTVGFA